MTARLSCFAAKGMGRNKAIARGSSGVKAFFIFLIFLMFIFEREGESMSGGGAGREGDTESEAGSRLRAVGTEPDARLKPMNHKIMT